MSDLELSFVFNTVFCNQQQLAMETAILDIHQLSCCFLKAVMTNKNLPKGNYACLFNVYCI